MRSSPTFSRRSLAALGVVAAVAIPSAAAVAQVPLSTPPPATGDATTAPSLTTPSTTTPRTTTPRDTTPRDTTPRDTTPDQNAALDGLTELGRDYPGLVGAMQRSATPAGRPTASPRILQIAPGRIVVSTVPMRTGGAPVDRTLLPSRHGYAPRNPIVSARFAEDASDGFTIGEAEDTITVEPVGADDHATEALGDAVLHADTHPATDSVVRSITGGAETFEVLHGAEAPEAFSYRVRAASGKPVTLRSEGARIIGSVDGHDVVAIPAPTATDAAGAAVPLTVTVDGSFLRVAVPHRGVGFSYPLLVDPEWIAAYDWTGNPAQGNGGVVFGYSPDGPNRKYDGYATTQAGQWGPGITIRPTKNEVYGEGDFGKVFLFAPPGSTIASATFSDVVRFNDQEKQTGRLALYSDVGRVAADDWSAITSRYQGSVTLTDPARSATSAQIWLFTAPCDYANGSDDPANCPRFVKANSQSHVTVGSVSVELVDGGNPSVSASGALRALAATWIDGSGTTDVTIGAEDNGSGIESLGLGTTHQSGATGELIPEKAQPCNDDHAAQGQTTLLVCGEVAQPESRGFTLDSLPEGVTTFEPFATDYAGNRAEGGALDWQVGVDRTNPVIDGLTGSLFAAGWHKPAGVLAFGSDVHDRPSGVERVAVALSRDAPGDVLQESKDLCAAVGAIEQPCSRDRSWSVSIQSEDLPEGEIQASATVFDHVGRSSAAVTRSLFVDRTAPRATATGALTDLDGRWTSADGDAPVTIKARDSGSGIARIELYGNDGAGRRLLASRDVCDPATLAGAERCPALVEEELSVRLEGLDTGTTRLEAFAIDAAGNRTETPDTWQAFVDHDAPSTVHRISAVRTDEGEATVRWDPADDPDSGVDGYEFRIISSTTGVGEWTRTKLPFAQIPNAPTVPFHVEIRAEDRAGNKSDPSSSNPLARRLEAFVWTVARIEGAASAGGLITAAGSSALLNRLLRIGVKTTVVALIGDYLIQKAITNYKLNEAAKAAPGSCTLEATAFRRNSCVHPFQTARANVYDPYLKLAAKAKSLVAAGSSTATYYATQASLAQLQQTVADLRVRYASVARDNPLGDASSDRIDLAYAEVAGRMDQFAVAVAGLRAQLMNKTIEAAQKKAAAAAVATIAGGAIEEVRRCATAERGKVGSGKKTVLVYWAPPPRTGIATQYVGITNDFGRRCVATRAVRALMEKSGATLRLPPMERYVARTVEQALISHFGMSKEPYNGQLLNERNEFNILSPGFCAHLFRGQAVLRKAGYAAFTTATTQHLGGRTCFGLGTWP